MGLVYLPTWMVDFYGFDVGKYSSPMDCLGNLLSTKKSICTLETRQEEVGDFPTNLTTRADRYKWSDMGPL